MKKPDLNSPQLKIVTWTETFSHRHRGEVTMDCKALYVLGSSPPKRWEMTDSGWKKEPLVRRRLRTGAAEDVEIRPCPNYFREHWKKRVRRRKKRLKKQIAAL